MVGRERDRSLTRSRGLPLACCVSLHHVACGGEQASPVATTRTGCGCVINAGRGCKKKRPRVAVAQVLRGSVGQGLVLRCRDGGHAEVLGLLEAHRALRFLDCAAHGQRQHSGHHHQRTSVHDCAPHSVHRPSGRGAAQRLDVVGVQGGLGGGGTPGFGVNGPQANPAPRRQI